MRQHKAPYKGWPGRSQDFYPHIDEGSPETWAVSYADLLMVILSFFIIFFSFEAPVKIVKSRDAILEKITATISKTPSAGMVAGAEKGLGEGAGGGIGFGPGAGVGDSPITSGNSRFPRRSLAGDYPLQAVPDTSALNEKLRLLSRELSTNSVSTSVERSSLVVNLSPDLYEVGKFQMNKKTQEELARVLGILEPYFKDISLTMVGHTDSLQYAGNSTIISDNFSLSSLRAAHALKLVVAKGFPPDELYATGSAENIRNSRTLSLKIQPKGAMK